MKWFWNRFGGWIIVTSFTFLGTFIIQISRVLEIEFLRTFVSTVIYGAYGINYSAAQFIYFQF